MTNKKYYNFLIFACVFLWIIMMGSKNVYTAEIVELVGIFSVTETEVSLAMTYYFITYSTAQVIMFFFMDNINIKWFLGVSMVLSGAVTIFIALMTNMWQMWWLLAFNGVLQAGVWGMCLAVLKKFLPSNMLPKANTLMNVGMAVAGIISYGSASLFVGLGRWDLPYYILGAILSVSAIIFIIAVHLCEKNLTPSDKIADDSKTENKPVFNLKSSASKAIFFVSAFFMSLIIHSTFYAGMNWMPSMLTQNHGLDNAIGILISVFAPVATILGAIASIYHCEKYKNFLTVSVIYLLIGAILSLLMVFLFKSNIIVATLLIVLYLVVYQGIITIVFGVLPLKVGNGINAGGLGCLMNAAGGFAAGFAPLISSYIFRSLGWAAYYLVILAISVFVLIVTTLIWYFISKNNKANN